MLVLVRGEVVRGAAASALFRVGITAPVVLSYFQLRWILPAITTRALDPQIYAFDLRVFHYEPSVAWDRFVSPNTVEWFAFFYFGYFIIVACNVLPFLALAGDTKLMRHFGTGLVAQFCFTHVLYFIVPGFGPYHELRFDHELQGGPFWALVLHSVHSAGALKDIFPSLHTGAPTFFAIFAFVAPQALPFKYTWPVLAFCSPADHRRDDVPALALPDRHHRGPGAGDVQRAGLGSCHRLGARAARASRLAGRLRARARAVDARAHPPFQPKDRLTLDG